MTALDAWEEKHFREQELRKKMREQTSTPLTAVNSTPLTAVTKPCIHCNETSAITVDAVAYRRWRSGAYIQEAFPDMDADNRELLVSGTHPACWDTMFGDNQ